MHATLFVIEGAFDRLWWRAILKELERTDCAAGLYGIIYSCQDSYVGQFSKGKKTVSNGPSLYF